MSETNGTDSESSSSAADRRTLRGMLVKPRKQVKYSFLFMGGGMLLLTVFIGAIGISLQRTLEALEAAYGLDPELSAALQSSYSSTLLLTFVISAVLALFAFLVGIQLSHRVYGPLIPLQKHIEELNAGNYGSRVKLRKHDELMELQDSLNELAGTLQSRYGSHAKAGRE